MFAKGARAQAASLGGAADKDSFSRMKVRHALSLLVPAAMSVMAVWTHQPPAAHSTWAQQLP